MYSEIQRLIIDTQPTIIQYLRLRRHPCIMQSAIKYFNPMLTGLLNTRQNGGEAYFTPLLIRLFFTLQA